MKNFLKVFITISFITILLMFFLDKGYSHAFKNAQHRSKIHNILQSKNKHYDVAFFGSSRTRNHIDCKLITELTGKSCINFGITAGSPGDMLIIMKLAESRKIFFKQVFMQVDYNYNRSGISQNFRSNFIGPLIADPVVKKQLRKYEENNIYESIPFYHYMKFERIIGLRELIASFNKRNPYKELDLEIGFSPLRGIGKDVADSFPEEINNTSEEFKQMQNFYKNTDSKIEFFTAPYCKEVENRNFMDEVQLKLPGLHNYIDLFDDKDEYFFNCGHLNEAGAKVFTITLIHDLLK